MRFDPKNFGLAVRGPKPNRHRQPGPFKKMTGKEAASTYPIFTGNCGLAGGFGTTTRLSGSNTIIFCSL